MPLTNVKLLPGFDKTDLLDLDMHNQKKLVGLQL
jgi:hypothetical protein